MNLKIAILAAPLILAVVTAAGSAGIAVSETPLQRALSQEYVRYNRAIKAKDIQTIMGMLTPDFSWHVGDGKALNRQQTRKALAEYLDEIRFVEKADFRIEKISAAGKQAHVVVTETISALIPAGPNKMQRRVTTETLKETWVRTGRGWKVKKSEILKTRETLVAMPEVGRNE